MTGFALFGYNIYQHKYEDMHMAKCEVLVHRAQTEFKL
jgi:hypothetical protein